MSLKSVFGSIKKAVVGGADKFLDVQAAIGKVAVPLVANAVAPGSGQIASNIFNSVNNLRDGLMSGGSSAGTGSFDLGSAGGLLKDASSAVNQVATGQLQYVANLPALSVGDAVNVAAQVATNMRSAGATEEQASQVAQVATAAAQQSPEQARGFVDDVLKPIVKGALQGAQDGAIDSYLNQTAPGQAAKKDAINKAGTSMMPYIMGAGLGLLLLLRKK